MVPNLVSMSMQMSLGSSYQCVIFHRESRQIKFNERPKSLHCFLDLAGILKRIELAKSGVPKRYGKIDYISVRAVQASCE